MNMGFLLLSTLLYFLPTIIGRHHPNSFGIFLVNFLLGWTVIGWLAALIWACSTPRCYVPVQMAPASAGRFCSQCGTLSPLGARFCAACGRSV